MLAFSLKFEMREPLSRRGGMLVFFVVVDESFIRGPEYFGTRVGVRDFFTQVLTVIYNKISLLGIFRVKNEFCKVASPI